MIQIIVPTILVAIVLVIITIQFIYPRLWMELSYMMDKIQTSRKIKKYSKQAIPTTAVDLLETHARKTPDKPFMVYRDVSHTYGEVNKRANRLAHLARQSGVKRGDTVAILVRNEPAFVETLFGMAKLGVTSALLNFNLRSKSLLHCFEVSQAKTLIIGPGEDLMNQATEILEDLKLRGIRIWVLDSKGLPLPDGMRSIEDAMNNNLPPDKEELESNLPRSVRQGMTLKDPFVYIYTSGTTGLPKAGRMSHYKMMASGDLLNFFKMSTDDVVYVTLPLYHVSALFFGLSNVLNKGATMVLRSKFSATHFWTDCRKHDVTIVLYIGELFRYLLARTKEHDDADNKVRLAVGNGLGADIWQEVQSRFGVTQIVETYGATESNFGIMNLDNKVGSVGCWGPLMRTVCQIQLVKFDHTTAQPIRDKNGRCVVVGPGELGLLICPVNKTFPLEGYVGKKELTQKKMLFNVLRDGDAYFNTGDVFTQDKKHYLFFKDRLGDTFRWKGENVATTEVAKVLNAIEGVIESNVYGVSVEGNYGKAGMAALILQPDVKFDPVSVFKHVTNTLPNYACPRFIRLPKALEHTATFKQKKTQLVQEGFDPEIVKDPLYFYHFSERRYVPLDKELYANIMKGVIRV